MKSQNEKILSHLMRGRKITPISALNEFGCFRLAARISELREQGYEIEAARVEKEGKMVAQYSIPIHARNRIAVD